MSRQLKDKGLPPQQVEDRLKYLATPEHLLEQRLVFSIWSDSTSPYEQGLIQAEASPSGLKIRWDTDTIWRDLPWHELAMLGGSLTEILKSNIELEKERGYNEGIALSDEDEQRLVSERRANIRVLQPAKAASGQQEAR